MTGLEDDPSVESPWFKALVIIFAVSVFVGGMLGNSLTILAVAKYRRMRTVTNIFICQLAISDVIILLFCLPFTLTSFYIFEAWIYGVTFCKVVMFFQAFAVFMEHLTLTAMCFERYYVLVHPMAARRHWKRKSAIKIGLCLYVIAAIAAIPRPLLGGMLQAIPPSMNQSNSTANMPHIVPLCVEALPSKFTLVYNSFRVIVFYVIPVITMAILYSRIAHRLRLERVRANDKIQNERRNVVRMLIAMVTIFAICLFPYNVFLVVQSLPNSYNIFFSEWFHWFFFATGILLYVNCISNPILYTFMSSGYRAYFKRLICPCLAPSDFQPINSRDSCSAYQTRTSFWKSSLRQSARR